VADVELGQAGGLADRAAGAGRPLVLLHPGPGRDGLVFIPEVLMLAARGHRVIAIDLPANGHSFGGYVALEFFAADAAGAERLRERRAGATYRPVIAEWLAATSSPR
jgi:pimeloyl-ACP methyl ester carboxylesterase